MGWLIALIVLLVLAVLVTVVIWFPVGIRVIYDCKGLRMWYTLGPVRLLSYPVEEKKEDSPVKQILNETLGETKKYEGVLGEFWSDLRTTLKLFWCLRPKLRITRLNLTLITASQDPASAALQYGAAWAAVGDLLPILEEAFILKRKNIRILCDYEAKQTQLTARLDLRIPFGQLISRLVHYSMNNLEQKS